MPVDRARTRNPNFTIRVFRWKVQLHRAAFRLNIVSRFVKGWKSYTTCGMSLRGWLGRGGTHHGTSHAPSAKANVCAAIGRKDTRVRVTVLFGVLSSSLSPRGWVLGDGVQALSLSLWNNPLFSPRPARAASSSTHSAEARTLRTGSLRSMRGTAVAMTTARERTERHARSAPTHRGERPDRKEEGRTDGDGRIGRAQRANRPLRKVNRSAVGRTQRAIDPLYYFSLYTKFYAQYKHVAACAWAASSA